MMPALTPPQAPPFRWHAVVRLLTGRYIYTCAHSIGIRSIDYLSEGNVGLEREDLATTVSTKKLDHALLNSVSLQTHGQELVVDGHSLLSLAACVSTQGLLNEGAREVGGTRELVTGSTAPSQGWNGHLRKSTRGCSTPGLRQEIVGGLDTLGRHLVQEDALTVLVAAILLNHDVVPIRRSEPLKAINVLKSVVALAAVTHGSLIVTISANPLATELNLSSNVRLTLNELVFSCQAVGQIVPRNATECGNQVGQMVDAHVARGRALHVRLLAQRVGSVVLRLLSGLVAAQRGPELESGVVGRRVLELPRLVSRVVLHCTVPLPVRGLERARNVVRRLGTVIVLVPGVAIRRVGGHSPC